MHVMKMTRKIENLGTTLIETDGNTGEETLYAENCELNLPIAFHQMLILANQLHS